MDGEIGEEVFQVGVTMGAIGVVCNTGAYSSDDRRKAR